MFRKVDVPVDTSVCARVNRDLDPRDNRKHGFIYVSALSTYDVYLFVWGC